ncbi:MAG: hypothetical protein K9N06_13330 [Candidatus Cloacimonetes bacterium]|nr:hypothetical protein [Candidatus Cloacimonadota bacterium]
MKKAYIYINYEVVKKKLEINEYRLSTTAENLGNIDVQIEEIKEKVRAAEYFNDKYKFDYWVSLEERMLRERDMVSSSSDLYTKETDQALILEDCFEKVLNRPVRLISTEHWTSLCFAGDDIKIVSCTGSVLYKDNMSFILWDNLLDYFGIEFVLIEDLDKTLSLYDYFGAVAESPILSEEEIEQWKEAHDN